jgi:hypothetical protein
VKKKEDLCRYLDCLVKLNALRIGFYVEMFLVRTFALDKASVLRVIVCVIMGLVVMIAVKLVGLIVNFVFRNLCVGFVN